MYRATKPCLAGRGMRRILKSRGSIKEYIRQAVQSGTYRTTEELAAMKKPQDAEDGRFTAGRFRHNLVRGSSILDYPVEYTILQQHPPLPDPPRTPKRLQKQRRPKENVRVETLVHKYWNRQKQQEEQRNQAGASGSSTRSKDTEWYYRTLLNVPPPSEGVQGEQGTGATTGFLSTKSVALRQAYNAAIHHYQLERTSEQENLSEFDIMAQVDQLLTEAARQEAEMAQATAQHAKMWRAQQKQQSGTMMSQQKDVVELSSSLSLQQKDTPAISAGGDSGPPDDWLAALQENPRTWQALQRWSDRLRAVPYTQWTIGAATALDHWIAVTILGVSEDTWQAVLQGDDEETSGEIGPALVAVRQALFPETIVDSRALPVDDQEPDSLFDSEEEEDKNSAAVKSVDDLLEALGNMTEEPEEGMETIVPSVAPTDRVTKMTDELQDWRRQKQEGSSIDEDTFEAWTRRYMETLGIPNNAMKVKDFGAALLADGPLDRQVSDLFWDRLSTRQGAELLAEDLHTDEEMASVAARFGVAAGNADELWNVAAIRPLLDEYALESDRKAFLVKYGDILMEGTPLEYLQVLGDGDDQDGSISTSSLPKSWAGRLPAATRVRVQMMGFRSNVDDDLYSLWKEHKAGRARYEEKLFRTKRLGITYKDDPFAIDEEDDDD